MILQCAITVMFNNFASNKNIWHSNKTHYILPSMAVTEAGCCKN